MPKLSIILRTCGKTINLAKSTAYQIPRKPPLNTLIFEKLPEPRCGDKITCGIKGPPITKPVRICTKEDMQAFYCPPVPCDCKVKPPPLTITQKIGYLVKQFFKALFVGGIAYFTYKEGIWGSAFHSSCFLEKFRAICPEEDEDIAFKNEFADLRNVVLQDLEPCSPLIPSSALILYKLGYYWNQIVIFTIWFLIDGPGELLEFLLNLFRPKPTPPEISPCKK